MSLQVIDGRTAESRGLKYADIDCIKQEHQLRIGAKSTKLQNLVIAENRNVDLQFVGDDQKRRRGWLPEQYLVTYPSFEVDYEELFSLPDCYTFGRRRLDDAHLARVRAVQELRQKQAEVAELAARLENLEDQLRSTIV